MVCEHSQWSLTIQTIQLSKILMFIFLSITFFLPESQCLWKNGDRSISTKYHDAYKKKWVYHGTCDWGGNVFQWNIVIDMTLKMVWCRPGYDLPHFERLVSKGNRPQDCKSSDLFSVVIYIVISLIKKITFPSTPCYYKGRQSWPQGRVGQNRKKYFLPSFSMEWREKSSVTFSLSSTEGRETML